jgi:hypothetical protein
MNTLMMTEIHKLKCNYKIVVYTYSIIICVFLKNRLMKVYLDRNCCEVINKKTSVCVTVTSPLSFQVSVPNEIRMGQLPNTSLKH